jgi:putative intracellular protease/amidase
MSNRKVLFILTGHDRLGSSGDTSAAKTGFHLSEAAQPWKVLTDAGFDIDFATPTGGAAPIDPSSRDMDIDANKAFLSDERVSKMLERTPAIKSMTLSDYDAIYFPGGHGTMWDFPENQDIQRSVRDMYESGKVVAAVCHGPAALINVRLSNGRWLVDGKTLSTFTDEEERAVDKAGTVPFLLGKRLEERGAKLRKADNFKKSVSVDGRLITGQNPASAVAVGEAIRDVVLKDVAEAA